MRLARSFAKRLPKEVLLNTRVAKKLAKSRTLKLTNLSKGREGSREHKADSKILVARSWNRKKRPGFWREYCRYNSNEISSNTRESKHRMSTDSWILLWKGSSKKER